MWLARQRASCCHLFPSFRRCLLASIRLFSPSAGAEAPLPAEHSHFMVDYLRSTCAFSDAEARRASKHYSHLKSPDRPDAVLRLLRQEGLGDADIKRIVQKRPVMLLADLARTLEPKIRALQGAGFSGPEVAQLITMNPSILNCRNVVARVEFWKKLVGTNQGVLKVTKRDPRSLSYNLDKRVVPGLSLLRSLGVPENKMASLVGRRPDLACGNPDRTRTVVEKVNSLGFLPGTGMFVEALTFIDQISGSTFDAKSKLLMSFGWTQAELVSAVRVFPPILKCSQKKLHAVMDFLLNEAGCELSYIARHSSLFSYSMEKRLKPRFYVLQSLNAEGIRAGRNGFLSAMMINEDSFFRKYVTPYSGKLPKLLENYHAACAKNDKANMIADEQL